MLSEPTHRIGIVGSKTFYDHYLFEDILNSYRQTLVGVDVRIISGGAGGIDNLAAKYAIKHDLTLIEHLPERQGYGEADGAIRKALIVQDSDFIIAFWDGKSKGTAYSLKLAKERKVRTLIIYF